MWGRKVKSENTVLIVGFLEQIQHGLVRGWARNVSDDETLMAELSIDGVAIGACSCDLFREDVLNAGQGSGFSGFEFKLTDTNLDPESRARVVVHNASGYAVEAERQPIDISPAIFAVRSEGQNAQSQLRTTEANPAPIATVQPTDAEPQHPQSLPMAARQADESSRADASHRDWVSGDDWRVTARDNEPVAAGRGNTAGNGHLSVVLKDTSDDGAQVPSVDVVGYIDAVDANRVLGWAFRDLTPDERLCVEILIDDEVVGEAVSDIYREDLSSAGIGDGSHGFRFDFPRGLFAGRPQQVSVRDKKTRIIFPFATGVNAIVETDTRIDGAADMLTSDTISGWAINYREMDRPVELAIYVGSKLVGRGRTDYYRKDIASQKGGHGFYGFRIRLNQKIFYEDLVDLLVMATVYDHKLRVAESFGKDLPNRSVEKEAQSKIPSVRGYLDRADRETIAGWAVNEAKPEVATTVDIYVNEFLIRSTVAGLTRKDLATIYPASGGRLGFNYQIPYGHSLRGRATVSARSAEGNKPVAHSPKEGMLGRPGLYLESPSVRRHREAIRTAQAFEVKRGTGYAPRVTAIVLNRDGEEFLEALFESVDRYNTYSSLDFVIVDHGSTDGSQAVCNRWKDKLSITFIDRRRNYSYSASNNFGVAHSDAEVLFFLNNDIRFCSDFLSKAVQQLGDDVGIVGFKLASPPEQVRTESGLSRVDLLDVGIAIDQIQHLGVRMTTAAGDRPFLPFEEPLTRDNDGMSSQVMEVPCVTAAALLIRRKDFLQVGGFHEEYFYGFEDVDFCLTFQNITKKKIICLNDVKLYHFRSASLQKVGEAERNAKAKNKDIIARRLGGYILSELKKERISNTSFLRDSTVRVALLVSEASDTTSAGDYFTGLELARELSERYRFECVFLPSTTWYDLSDFDVAIAMVDGFKPSAITSCRSDIILVAWIRNWFDRLLAFPEMDDFDAIWVSSEKALHAFNSRFVQNVELIRIGTNADYFSAGSRVQEYTCDYCFTGSYFGSWREIIGFLAPASLPYEFALFGHGWNDVTWLEPYYRGPLPYSKMRDVYASTRIVIDDANHTTLAWGSANSRVFDALAAGALVITNSRAASDDAFEGLLPVFETREGLQALLERYLGNEHERRELVDRLRGIVREKHTYTHRAETAAGDINRLLKARRIGINFDEGESIDGVADILKEAVWADGDTAHFTCGKSALTRARGFGLDIDIRITGLLGAALPADILKCRFNVLIALFQPERISQFQAREFGALFDLIVTPTDAMADIFRSAGARQVYSLKGQFREEGCATFERKTHLEGLFRRGAAQLLEQLAAAHNEWGERCRTVEPSVGPSLQLPGGTETEATLRIGYVLWDFPALSQTFIINEIRWLALNGYDVKVYYKVWADRPAKLDFEVPIYEVENHTELAALLVKHERTVMHSPFAFPATVHLTYPAAQATGIPFTIMPAGVDISHYDNMQRNRITEITNSPLCIGVMTIGSFHQEFLVEQGVPERKILLERQAVALPDFPHAATPAPRTGHRRLRVVSIGRFVEKKGLRYLIEAAAQLPDCEIVLYGYGPLEDDLRALAARMRAGNVTFGGSLDDQEALWHAYAEADVFCLPCVRAADGDLDGLPTVILEAMGAGVPVVSSRIANVPDVVVDGITGFLAEPKDVDGLAKAIRSAISMEKGQCERLINAARRKAQSYASVEDTMSTLVRVWSGKGLDIVLVTYDKGKYKSLQDTEEIIDRVFRFTSLPFNVIVVDNGSDQSFLDHLNEKYGNLPNFRLIALGKNLWCGPGTNLAIEAGSSEFVVYLCSKEGYVLRRGWERDLVKYMEKNPEIGMAGHLVTLPNWRDGATYLSYPQFDKFRNPKFASDNPRRQFNHVQGGVYILRRKAYNEAGGFSTDIPQNGTDVEYSYFLESNGWALGDIPNVYSATVLTQPSITAMVDERMVVVHPLSTRTVGYFDKIVSASTKACNVCGWQGQHFAAKEATNESVCPSCGAHSFARSVLRLLSLTGNLQQKPRTWLVSDDESLVPLLRRLSTELVWDRDLTAVAPRMRRDDFDLVLVDHQTWDKKDATQFVAWAEAQVNAGRALVLGEGLKNDPVAGLAQNLNGEPILYDSVVSDFDRLTIRAFNIEVHP